MCFTRLLGRIGRAMAVMLGESDSGWPPNPATHDYRTERRGWGHDYTIERIEHDGQILHATGWGPRGGMSAPMRRGDYLKFSRDGGGIADVSPETRYRVARIEYRSNALDMWSAELWWHGRPECQTDRSIEDRWSELPTAKTVPTNGRT